MKNLGSSKNRKTKLKLIQDYSGRASILGTPIYIFGGDRVVVKDNIYDKTPEI